jgi:hypothetical protein
VSGKSAATAANKPDTETGKLCGACKTALDKLRSLWYNDVWQFYSKERIRIATFAALRLNWLPDTSLQGGAAPLDPPTACLQNSAKHFHVSLNFYSKQPQNIFCRKYFYPRGLTHERSTTNERTSREKKIQP